MPTSASAQHYATPGATAQRRLCGLCERPVTSITFSLFGFQVEERACSPCGWNALLVDGAVTTMDGLLARANAIDHEVRRSA